MDIHHCLAQGGKLGLVLLKRPGDELIVFRAELDDVILGCHGLRRKPSLSLPRTLPYSSPLQGPNGLLLRLLDLVLELLEGLLALLNGLPTVVKSHQPLALGVRAVSRFRCK